jgi:NADH dehydrogenase
MWERGWVLLPRVYLGVIFAVAAVGKLTARVDFAGPMTGFLTGAVVRNGHGWYAGFLRAVVLPHAHVFATLVLLGEVFVAVSMIFGLLTRVGAVVAIVLLANYLCAKGLPFWSPASNDAADIVLALVVLFSGSGRVVGLDKSLHERFPKVPFF